jgi:replicative DNA helicase
VSAVWDDVSAAVDAYDNGTVVDPGLPTGVPDLDRLTGGIRKGDLILLAARPSMGKTSMAMQIAADVASRGLPVLFFSLEMGRRDVAGRALWQRARVDGTQALRGRVDAESLARLVDAVGAVSPWSLRVDDTPALPVQALLGRAKAYAAEKGGLGLVVVDYLQLLRSPRRDGNRTQEVTEISQRLKALARDLDAPVLALSQLNRQVEHRSDPQPHLADLRDSGALEQDADQVWLVWRESREAKVAKLEVAKHRNGPTGQIELFFEPAITRFDALETRFGRPT